MHTLPCEIPSLLPLSLDDTTTVFSGLNEARTFSLCAFKVTQTFWDGPKCATCTCELGVLSLLVSRTLSPRLTSWQGWEHHSRPQSCRSPQAHRRPRGIPSLAKSSWSPSRPQPSGHAMGARDCYYYLSLDFLLPGMMSKQESQPSYVEMGGCQKQLAGGAPPIPPPSFCLPIAFPF